jgi:hypothetical protein
MYYLLKTTITININNEDTIVTEKQCIADSPNLSKINDEYKRSFTELNGIIKSDDKFIQCEFIDEDGDNVIFKVEPIAASRVRERLMKKTLPNIDFEDNRDFWDMTLEEFMEEYGDEVAA